ncbi:TetR/AcrR family transcriptional regulator [Agitococcus lubricus]|uniref:TetR family transcriptional regulator n=1 Tax=Agitococcus lubricus TaxID=1077255 RepID=A0A2T5IWS2_9GAMM|nr:TetR/AcrR family transcriptional regulator [Agitococcus lubricus]PTQ88332.1 TetR family transcriptional regulator [Agitococcus lubricus]
MLHSIPTLDDKISNTTDKGLLRAQEILLAAQQIFIEQGYAGLSMRGVANRLNIHLSTVQHYYKNKELLLEALLIYILDDYQQRIAYILQSMPHHSPLERFMAIMDMLLIEIKRPEMYSVFVEIWALAGRLTVAAELIQTLQIREQKELTKLIYGLNPALSYEECKLRALMIATQIHGLMLQLPCKEPFSLVNQQLDAAARASFLRLAMGD